MPVTDLRQALTIVLLLHNCDKWITRTLDHLTELDVPIVAVDNASVDRTREIGQNYRRIKLIALPENVGAAGRNVGAERATTPFVAFCDDDGWYEAEGLQCAVELLERHPGIGLINARITVGVDDEPDPISLEMAASPLLDRETLPGTKLLSFMGGASIMRRNAYLGV